MGLEIFRGMSGAGAGPEAQEKYLSGPGRHIEPECEAGTKGALSFYQEPPKNLTSGGLTLRRTFLLCYRIYIRPLRRRRLTKPAVRDCQGTDGHQHPRSGFRRTDGLDINQIEPGVEWRIIGLEREEVAACSVQRGHRDLRPRELVRTIGARRIVIHHNSVPEGPEIGVGVAIGGV